MPVSLYHSRIESRGLHHNIIWVRERWLLIAIMRPMLGKKDFFKLGVFIIFFIVSFSSCVYDREFAYLNDQIIALNKRVTKLQESLGSDLDSRLDSIHSRQAEVGVEIDQLRQEIEGLSGRVEDNEQLIKRTVERDLDEQDAMRSSLAELTQKVAELETLAKRQHEDFGIKPMPPEEDRGEVRAAIEKEETGPELPAILEEPKSKELELYDMSLASFREGKYEEATEGFKALLERYPKSDRADNAQFWIGECYLALRQYEQAILAYQRVIEKHPEGNKVPSAMLRQAMAFLEIEDKTSTRLLLKKIINKYPESSEAEIAQKKLEALK